MQGCVVTCSEPWGTGNKTASSSAHHAVLYDYLRMGNLLGEVRERRWRGRSTSMGYDPTSHKTVYMGCVRGCWNVPHWGKENNEEREEANQELR
jgi:hypothetical protein